MLRRKVLQTVGACLGGIVGSQTGVANAMPEVSRVRPRHVVCFLGQWKSLSTVEKVVVEFGHGFSLDMEYSQTTPDPRMERAFAASSDRMSRTFAAKDQARVRRHRAVAYVLSPSMERETSAMVSTHALQLVDRLIQAGATAVKSESAGVAHGLDHWVHLAQNRAIRAAWVRRPIREAQTLHSCGMHLMGQPDIECVGDPDEREAVRWIDSLSDLALRGQLDVNRPYAVDEKTSKRLLEVVPCSRYEADDFCFNPYGYIRITA